jgi:hypothetical protein
MRKLLFWLLALGLSGQVLAQGEPAPVTTNNDDSCDIAVMPAATLLVPYFEVAVNEPPATARTTVFTVTNVTRMPQIAHVTLWSDWAYPVLTFNIFLTGYDVQSINLYDVLVRGVIAPGSGTSSETEEGARSLDNDANPNFASNAGFTCAHLPGAIPASLLEDLRKTLTVGLASGCGTTRVGGWYHPNYAAGYVTIDVTSQCSPTLPTSVSYYTTELLFDNALTGDVIQVDPKGNAAGGSPMVHIRAVPEGGAAGSFPGTRLPYTFYDRFTPEQARTIDRRQPLPSSFSARYIDDGTPAFSSSFVLWREGMTGGDAACARYAENSGMPIPDPVRFDEHENPTLLSHQVVIGYPPTEVRTFATFRVGNAFSGFPFRSTASNDVSGWLYLNLNNGGSAAYSSQREGFRGSNGAVGPAFARQSQNWVVVSMTAEGRYSVDLDATALGNGCSPAAGLVPNEPIGPAPNTSP